MVHPAVEFIGEIMGPGKAEPRGRRCDQRLTVAVPASDDRGQGVDIAHWCGVPGMGVSAEARPHAVRVSGDRKAAAHRLKVAA